MPVKWLTEAEQERLNRFPAEIQLGDVIAFFTLTDADLKLVRQHHGEANRLGFALQLCALRYLGFIPDDLKSAPDSAVSFLARQLGASVEAITDYGKRGHTRSDHALEIQSHLGFRKLADEEWIEIERWLTARAMEHDRPLLLLSMLCERLHATKLVRPGITLLERAVSSARGRAQDEDGVLLL